VHSDSIPRGVLAAILLCFFLSGAAGLAYQVAWGKALGLVFGHTVYAIATVLAVFMGGLAAGSAYLGRWSESRARPVALYGLIELVIAAAGALSLVGLAAVRALYLAAYDSVAGSAPALLALRFAGAALVLLAPTFLMGGTLPILVRGLTRSSAELGARVSRLYWVNTAGAVAGTLAAGFLLLPLLGLRLTVATAVGLNTLAGLIALALDRFVPAIPPTPEPAADSRPGESLSGFLLTGFTVVGATAIVYEVGWTRLLAITLGSSTYAFTLMLATFLAGIVLGSLIFERWAAHGGEPTLVTFAHTQTLTALAATAFLIFFQKLPEIVPPILRATGESFAGLILAQFVTSAAAMLPAAVVFGFNFPVVTVLIAGRPETSGRYAAAVGKAYAANTLGAIAGAVTAGFWLVPRIGAFRTVALAAVANLLLAAVLHLRREAHSRFALVVQAVLLVVVLGGAFSGAFYNRALAMFGTVLYWDYYNTRMTLAEMAGTTDVVFAEDGLNASVAVVRTEDYVALRTNGKVDASNNDLLTQLLSGHLGMVFHPAPKRVLVIGFGSGMTVSAVARHPEVERIDCVEIEPGVIHASAHLERLHRGVVRDPRLRIVLDDARNFLLTTRETYDLIISEPSNPWIAGVASLFTDEYYREARARLRPGGLFVQWVQAYSLFPDDLRMIFATFLPHFPQVTLWRAESPDLLLLGQTEVQPLRFDRLRALWTLEGIREDLRDLHVEEPEGLLAYYLLDDANLRRLAQGAPRNTDNHTRLEYSAPRALLTAGLDTRNRARLREYRSAAPPREIVVEDRRTALLAAAHTAIRIEDYTEAQSYLDALGAEPPSAIVEELRGQLQVGLAHLEAAGQSYQQALQLDPHSLKAARGLADVARTRMELDTAELLYRQILARDADNLGAIEGMVEVARLRSHYGAAAEWQQRYLDGLAERLPAEVAKLGEYLFRAGKYEQAERLLLEAVKQEPYSYTAHRHLGELYAELGRWSEARHHLEQVERYYPDTDAQTYLLLSKTYTALGDARASNRALQKGLRLFPADSQLKQFAGPS